MGLSFWRNTSRLAWCTVTAVSFSLPLFAVSRDVLIDNAKVRVLRVVIEPEEKNKVDISNLNRVVIWLDKGDAEILSANAKPVNSSWRQNEIAWESASTSHAIRLKGNKPTRAIVVELKEGKNKGRAATSSLNPWIVDPRHYRIEFENRNARVIRVKIGPKESTPLHEHSLERVVVYLTALNFRIDPEGKAAEYSVQKAGAVAWGLPVRHTEHNVSDQEFEAVVIEPKY